MTKMKSTYYKFDACDGGCNRSARVRRLTISVLPDSVAADITTAGVHLCEYCWRNEMDWRRHMNSIETGGYGIDGPWLVFGFYITSPLGDDAEIALDQFPDEFFDDTGLSACAIFSTSGEPTGFAIMDDDGNTVDYARDMASLQDYMDDVRDMRAMANKPMVEPFLSDTMRANPRLVLLWDRVSGSATFDSYSIWLVYPTRTRLYGHTSRADGIHQMSENAIKHCQAVVKSKIHSDYLVVVLPRSGEDALGESQIAYVHGIGVPILERNMQVFADRGQTK